MAKILPRIRNEEYWKWGSSVTSGSDSAKRRTWAIFTETPAVAASGLDGRAFSPVYRLAQALNLENGFAQAQPVGAQVWSIHWPSLAKSGLAPPSFTLRQTSGNCEVPLPKRTRYCSIFLTGKKTM